MLIEFIIIVCKLQTKEGVNARVYIEWNEEFESWLYVYIEDDD